MDPGDSFGEKTIINMIVHKMHIQLEGATKGSPLTLNNTLYSEVSSAQLSTALSPTVIISFGGGLPIAEFRGGAQDAYRKH